MQGLPFLKAKSMHSESCDRMKCFGVLNNPQWVKMAPMVNDVSVIFYTQQPLFSAFGWLEVIV